MNRVSTLVILSALAIAAPVFAAKAAPLPAKNTKSHSVKTVSISKSKKPVTPMKKKTVEAPLKKAK